MDDDLGEQGFDPTTYGRSFADVYDDWYPSDAATAEAVRCLDSLVPETGRILELGVGTGRLALPLAARGHRLVGLDASSEMLDRLAAKTAGGPPVTTVLGDVGDVRQWPQGPFDLVVAAFNLVCNLVDAAAQAATFQAAASVLDPDGALVIEAFQPAQLRDRERRLEVREVTSSSVVLIATDTDPGLGVVTGQHIELRDGEPVRLRPWRIRVAATDELDGWAEAAGFALEHRWADWNGAQFDLHAASHVSVYRLRS